MHPVKKILVLVIVFITFFIIYNLLKTRQTIKTNYEIERKKLSEGFTEKEPKGISIKSIPDKYLSLPIREFIVKSSYNSALNDKNKVEKKQIRNVLERGCRLIDFEIYTRDNNEYVSYSDDPEFKSMSTENEVAERVSLASAFTTVVGYAFTDPAPSPNDPLFISLRIKNNSTEAYSRIASLIDYSFKNRLYSGRVNGETKLEDLMGKVVFIMDKTSSPDYKNYVKCVSEPCFKLTDYINMDAGTISFSKYSYTNLETLPQVPVMPGGKKTDIKTFMMVTPTRFDMVRQPDPVDTIAKWHPQFLLYNFSVASEELDAYENIFNKNEASFVPISVMIASRGENDKGNE